MGGAEDHVHLLAELAPDSRVSDFLRTRKADSSGWLRSELPDFGAFGWQAGYSSFTVSQSAAPEVAECIGDQAVHHRRRDFAGELAALLSRHGVDFDQQRYLD